jgi:hypothetical protein
MEEYRPLLKQAVKPNQGNKKVVADKQSKRKRYRSYSNIYILKKLPGESRQANSQSPLK